MQRMLIPTLVKCNLVNFSSFFTDSFSFFSVGKGWTREQKLKHGHVCPKYRKLCNRLLLCISPYPFTLFEPLDKGWLGFSFN